MNIYARYFNTEVLTHNFDELMDFLTSIPEIPVDQRMVDEIQQYAESDMPYPKRYKIRPRIYFILIKTNANTMEEFKSHQKGHNNAPQNEEEFAPSTMQQLINEPYINKKEYKMSQLQEVHEGWYLGTITFKRVIQIAGTPKFRYQDTTFQAYVRAKSGKECYDKIIDHLKMRQEIDLRSQFPSARGSNFNYEFVGTELPTE